MAGWKKALLVAVGALFSVVVLLVVGGVGTFLWASATADRLGEPTPVPVALSVPMVDEAAPGTSAVVGSPGDAVRLEIALQDGEFEIVPGPAGADVRVDGTYASNYYELVQTHGAADAAGVSATTIILRPTSAVVVRLVGLLKADRRSAQQPNKLTVAIPVGRPIDLILRVTQGESRIELGGLTLTDLQAELSTGEHRLGFGEPLAEDLPRLQVDGQMGDIELHGLGNARPHEVRASSRMGNFTIDLGGDWPRDHVPELSVSHSMGDLLLRIPTTVRISPDSHESVRLGESGGFGRGEETSDPDAAVLRINLSTTMGATRVTRYEAASPEARGSRSRR